jgi:cell division protein FtsB
MQSRDTLRSTLPLILFALLAGSAAWACFGERGILTNRTLIQELEARTREVAEQNSTIEHLRRQIQDMRDDPRVQERWIREELGYVRPGEVLYLFPGDRSVDFAMLKNKEPHNDTRDSG